MEGIFASLFLIVDLTQLSVIAQRCTISAPTALGWGLLPGPWLTCPIDVFSMGAGDINSGHRLEVSEMFLLKLASSGID